LLAIVWMVGYYLGDRSRSKGDHFMKFERYRRKLLAKEQELLTGLKRTGTGGREKPDSAALDQGDQSVFSEHKESLFAQAHRDTQLLNEIRRALERIEDGSYGRCVEDGQVIEPARIEAIPWASYCLKHQAERDSGSSEH
jgi:DnaK suppressor protein